VRILLVKVGRGSANGANRVPQLLVSPPLGILQLAAYVKQQRGDDVRVLDLRPYILKHREQEALRRAMEELKPDVVGLSVLTHEHTAAHATAWQVRMAQPEVTILMGGPHPSMYPKRSLLDRNIDYIVCGEGELTTVALLDSLEAGGDPTDLPGVGGRREGMPVIGPARGLIPDLDLLPMPDWAQYDPHLYTDIDQRMSLAHDYKPYAAMSTSRGCPYQCTYCHDIFGKKFRHRSPEQVLEEMAYLKSRGIVGLELYDDIFNLDPDRMRVILEGMIRRNLQMTLSFPNGVRGDILTREDIKLLKRAGTLYISIAVESASPRIQGVMKKYLDLDKVRETINACVRQRIFTNAFFMLGFPTETRQEMQATVDFACASPLHAALFFSVVPHPATELGQETHQDELTAPIDDWNYSYGRVTLAAEEVEVVNRIQRQAYRRFYASPRRLARVLRDIPSLKRLTQVIREAGGRLLPTDPEVHFASYV